jgi:ubiquinone/menaquinone biosynthesis C-methylase UbiE
MEDIQLLYRYRFKEAELGPKLIIWKVLCERYFQKLIGADAVVLDVACGYGEFINNIRAKAKHAIDLNPDTTRFLSADVQFHQSRADSMTAIADSSVDVVFTSNFLEHLESKSACDSVFKEILRVLRPGGRFIVMGPNIKYLADKYWDFYDHHLPLSHLSLEEGLAVAGFDIKSVVAKFLPYTTRSALPKHPFLISLYLKMPIAWKILGKQFLLVATKPI